jgi:hypothetical protein
MSIDHLRMSHGHRSSLTQTLTEYDSILADKHDKEANVLQECVNVGQKRPDAYCDIAILCLHANQRDLSLAVLTLLANCVANAVEPKFQGRFDWLASSEVSVPNEVATKSLNHDLKLALRPLKLCQLMHTTALSALTHGEIEPMLPSKKATRLSTNCAPPTATSSLAVPPPGHQKDGAAKANKTAAAHSTAEGAGSDREPRLGTH